jgi:hypothetical protein
LKGEKEDSKSFQAWNSNAKRSLILSQLGHGQLSFSDT